jgi:hypothetical protein
MRMKVAAQREFSLYDFGAGKLFRRFMKLFSGKIT